MTKAIAQTYTTIHGYRLQITVAVLFACALSVIAYAFNVYAVVSHTVALGKVQAAISATASDVNDLDAKYLELSSTLTPDTLSRYGFSEGKVTAFIPRTAATASLSRALAASGHEF